ncbi:hypothetical protein ARALYDRAFT_908118 [Arabidopsis lyrata subsp. lyrata]|uniref:Uncharacterized protein n=1 Tax=Arabidopsis lyrata subsp. lyrata TaxID=81972 RepID=D7M7U1_ARALL|nr:hypothetical protein ARALYDRAFT_908118 [Arabidopsis lyrata subsp. lyrata]
MENLKDALRFICSCYFWRMALFWNIALFQLLKKSIFGSEKHFVYNISNSTLVHTQTLGSNFHL